MQSPKVQKLLGQCMQVVDGPEPSCQQARYSYACLRIMQDYAKAQSGLFHHNYNIINAYMGKVRPMLSYGNRDRPALEVSEQVYACVAFGLGMGKRSVRITLQLPESTRLLDHLLNEKNSPLPNRREVHDLFTGAGVSPGGMETIASIRRTHNAAYGHENEDQADDASVFSALFIIARAMAPLPVRPLSGVQPLPLIPRLRDHAGLDHASMFANAMGDAIAPVIQLVAGRSKEIRSSLMPALAGLLNFGAPDQDTKDFLTLGPEDTKYNPEGYMLGEELRRYMTGSPKLMRQHINQSSEYRHSQPMLGANGKPYVPRAGYRLARTAYRPNGEGGNILAGGRPVAVFTPAQLEQLLHIMCDKGGSLSDVMRGFRNDPAMPDFDSVNKITLRLRNHGVPDNCFRQGRSVEVREWLKDHRALLREQADDPEAIRLAALERSYEARRNRQGLA